MSPFPLAQQRFFRGPGKAITSTMGELSNPFVLLHLHVHVVNGIVTDEQARMDTAAVMVRP